MNLAQALVYCCFKLLGSAPGLSRRVSKHDVPTGAHSTYVLELCAQLIYLCRRIVTTGFKTSHLEGKFPQFAENMLG